MSEEDAAKEWGLPDWRDHFSYRNKFGDPSEWSFNRWRWEFLRRRGDYRLAFDKLINERRNGTIFRDSVTEVDENGYRRMVVVNPNSEALVSSAGEIGFSFSIYDDLELLSKFSMFFMPNPRFSEQPESSLLSANTAMASKFDDQGHPIDTLNYQFDLRKPLTAQLKACELMLKSCQARVGGAVKEEKHQMQNWLEYLQALDAREVGLSYNMMMGPAFPNRRTKNKIKGLVNQAEGVRDNF